MKCILAPGYSCSTDPAFARHQGSVRAASKFRMAYPSKHEHIHGATKDSTLRQWRPICRHL